MTAKKLRGFLEHAYMLAVCAFLLWDVAYMTEAEWTFAVRGWFPAVWCVLAGSAMLLSRLRHGAAWLMAALLAWMTAVSAYRGVLPQQIGPITHGVLAFLVVLPAPRVVARDRLMRYLRGTLAVWTAFLTAQAAVGLWAALSGHAVFSLKGTWYIGVNTGDHRLYLNAYVTTGAVKLGLSVLLAVYGTVISRKYTPRILYALCAALQLLCLSLTDCRTAFIAVGAALGVMLMTAILHGGKLRRGLRIACALLAIPVLAAGTYLTLSGALTALAPHVSTPQENITLTELPVRLLPGAEAEAAETGVQHRSLSSGNLFNDRQIIWRSAIRLLQEEPKFLVTGVTTELAAAETNARIPAGEYGGKPFVHVHCIYLQTLVSWGLPGLMLLGAFLAVFLRAAWRVMLRHALPLGWRLTPVPALYVMLCETVDCFTRLSENSPLLLFGCLFAGLTLAVDTRARYDRYANKPAASAVDVIIPVYNAAAYVTRAVESALACPQARVILVDDGSTDGSGAVCDALAARFDRVTVVHQQNCGTSSARNAGLAAATAEFVVFLDADDALLPGALAALLRQLGDADAIQGRIVRNTPKTEPREKTETLPAREALRRALMNPTCHLLCHGWLFRRSLLKEAFDESLTLGEDGEWLLRTLAGAKQAAFCTVPAYRYTVRADSALHGGSADVNGAYLQTVRRAEAPLKALNMPEAAAMYRLTHLLLILTHGEEKAALRLREEAPFAGDAQAVRLRGVSPRIMTLRLLRRRLYGPVRMAVRLRRRWNALCCAECRKSRNIPYESEVRPG